MKRGTVVRVLLLVAMAAVGAFGASGVVAAPEDGFVVGQAAGDPATLPDLTPDQERDALLLVAEDAWLKNFLGGQPYTVLDVGSWSNEVWGTIGAAVEIGWTLPITKEEALYPDVSDYMDAKQVQEMSTRCVESYCPPYRAGTVRYAISGATTMTLQVDLAAMKVVHAQVGTEAAFTPAADEPAEIEEHD